jgi:hypothetical protein
MIPRARMYEESQVAVNATATGIFAQEAFGNQRRHKRFDNLDPESYIKYREMPHASS